MKAILEINFFNEREIQERVLARKPKKGEEFSPIRDRIRKKRISSNTLTVTIRTRKPEHHFAKLISRGNFDFWDHDPGGFLMSVRFAQPDEDFMEQISKILRGVRKFHILPGNLSLSCYIAKPDPTYIEAEEILRRSCDAIKAELDPISRITISYDLSTTYDQEPQFYSKSEFLRHKPKEEDEERQPQKGPIDIERRPFDPKYAANHGSIEPEDALQDDYREEKENIRRDYKEPEYPQYSKDYYKKLQKRGYHKKKRFKASHAILITLGIAVTIGTVYGIHNGWFVLPNNFENQGNNQNTSQNTPSSSNQNPQQNSPVATNLPTTMSGCTMVSNGLGKVRINCPYYDTITCDVNPPLASGIQSGVILTINQNQCQVQYLDPQGNTIIRSLVLISQVTPNVNNNPQTNPPVQTPITTAQPSQIQSEGIFQVSIPVGVGNDQSCMNNGNCFDPDNITVPLRTKVTWTNNDSIGHTVTSGAPSDSETGTIFDSSLIASGQTYSFTFQNGGIYNYFCMIHPWMTGVITVGNENTSHTETTSPPHQTTSAPTQPSNINPQPNIYDLKNYALQLINQDRAAKGLNPVTLSSIPSAQNHADDQLSLKYFSHWNSDGVKPYVTYTKLGGKGSIAENDYYTYSYCPTSDCIENTFDPSAEIKRGENEMMNNDAASNWGHRDNILEPHHSQVSLGIAYDHERFYFVEQFEDNIVSWQSIRLVGSTLTLVGTIPTGYSMDHIDVFSDPEPKKLGEYELDHLPPYDAGFYDQGSDAGIILPQLSGNYYYPECSPGKTTVTWSDGSNKCLDYTTFTNNSANPNAINVSVDVSKWINSDGLHTVYVNLKDSSGNLVQATSLTLEYLK